MTILSNLFSHLPQNVPDELVQAILTAPNIRIERIVSHGQASPECFWYDQDQHEWVVVLKGTARLRFEGEEPVELKPGDFINIPAQKRHRVDWTTPDEPTIWLAVHYGARSYMIFSPIILSSFLDEYGLRSFDFPFPGNKVEELRSIDLRKFHLSS